jgi:hypothetical protein
MASLRTEAMNRNIARLLLYWVAISKIALGLLATEMPSRIGLQTCLARENMNTGARLIHWQAHTACLVDLSYR